MFRARAAMMDFNVTSTPTLKMVAYAKNLAAQTGASLPAGYDQDYEICHAFLDRNAPHKLDDQARAELRAAAPEIISSFLGEPNRKLSNKRTLRWHPHGSFALELTGRAAGCWYDHANKVGGDVISFIQAEHRCSVGHAIRIALELIGGFRTITSPAPQRTVEPEEDDAGRIAQALAIWDGTAPLRGSLAERYLHQRGIEVREDAALDVLRFHPSCPFGSRRAPALLALIQDIVTGEPLGIHRRELTADATSAGPPKILGPKSGGAIRLSDGDGGELTIGEGIETCLAGTMLGFRPAWSALDAGGITSFPLLDHIRRLTILVDNDVRNTGQKAATECRERWLAAGKVVRRVMPETPGHDINDLLLAQAERSQTPDGRRERAGHE
jgi:putative DNA primase/helicase